MYFKPINLRVDNMPSDRYAVCTKAPVFSWGIEHEDEKALQKAYIIKVWDGEKLLWDSGRIDTPFCEAEYKGVGLKPQMRVKWQLTLEDNENRLSSAAEGVFKVVPEELDTEWICEENNEESRAVYFAKQFVCGKEISRATLYACGIGYQDIRINGKKADDAVLQPMVSNFSHRCFFVTLEAEDLLNTGENCIGIKVGDGWRRNYGEYLKGMPPGREVEFFGVPQLAAKLVIEYTDGSAESIATDVSWYAFSGGTVKNHLFDGEVFDARFEPAGWDAPGFDYSNVKHASPAKPAGKLIPQFAEPIKIQDRIAPISKTMIEKGVYIFDFGVNIAGYAEIRIPEGIQAGKKIALKFSEEIKEDGALSTDTMRAAASSDEYISNGADGGSVWRPDFVYHGFRYMQLSGWHGVPDDNSVSALAVYSDVDSKSYFRCGSAIVNKIQENLVRTERDNLHGIATDCPQRDERMGWLNDATVRFEEIAYNFNVSRLFPKIIGDIVTEQDENGAITCTAPYVYGFRPADPVSSSFLIAGMQTYLHYGNKEIIRKYYPNFKAWNECLKNHSDNGIVNYSYYGDWAGTADSCLSFENANSAVTPDLLMSTGYHYYNYKLLAKMADILGDEKEKEENEREAQRVRKAYLDKWWDPETGVVATGSQGCQAFSLWLGILPCDGVKKAAEVLHRAVADIGYRIKAGNLTSRYVMDMLAEHGYIDDAWKIITREEYPSFGYMIQNGATTIWERFEQKKENGMNSHNHPMYGAVGSWFYSHIAGLIPKDNGWERFAVRPYIPTDLTYAQAHIDTVRGDVGINWFKRYGKLNVHITVPYGASAEYTYAGESIELKHGFHRFSYDI